MDLKTELLEKTLSNGEKITDVQFGQGIAAIAINNKYVFSIAAAASGALDVAYAKDINDFPGQF